MMCPEAEVALWLGAIDVVLGAGQDRHSGLLATCVATTLLDDPVAWTVANDPELPVRLAETLRAQGLGCPPVLVRLLRSGRSGAEGCMSAVPPRTTVATAESVGTPMSRDRMWSVYVPEALPAGLTSAW